MQLREDAWIQVDGDMDPIKHGGVFAKLDGDTVKLITVENVRELVGRDCAEVGFPFWKSTGSYDPSDLEWSDDAKGAMKFVGEYPSSRSWEEKGPVERTCLLFQYGVGKNASAGGGFILDILPNEPVLGFDDDDIRLDALAEDDEFLLDILHKAEVFRCVATRDGEQISDSLVHGRQAAAEWTKDAVLKAHENHDGFTEDYLTDWRQNPYRVTLPDGDVLAVEPYHLFHATEYSSTALYEAAEILCEEYGGEVEWSDLDHELVALLKDAPRG
jgi:hypothetical protein